MGKSRTSGVTIIFGPRGKLNSLDTYFGSLWAPFIVLDPRAPRRWLATPLGRTRTRTPLIYEGENVIMILFIQYELNYVVHHAAKNQTVQTAFGRAHTAARHT